MKQTIIAYVRISTYEQNIQRQEDIINSQFTVDRWFIDKISGKDYTLQTELQNLLKFVREGDKIVVESLSRLSRNTRDLLNIVDHFEKNNIELFSIKESIAFTNTPTGKLMFHLIASMSQFERENMKNRQREGIAIAKANGVYKGRQRIQKHPQFEHFYQKWLYANKANPYNLYQFASDLQMSRGTLYRFIKEHEKNEQHKKDN